MCSFMFIYEFKGNSMSLPFLKAVPSPQVLSSNVSLRRVISCRTCRVWDHSSCGLGPFLQYHLGTVYSTHQNISKWCFFDGFWGLFLVGFTTLPRFSGNIRLFYSLFVGMRPLHFFAKSCGINVKRISLLPRSI